MRHERPSSCTEESAAAPDGIQLNVLLEAHRRRESFFGSHLFSDPAWDILLNAYAALLSHESWSLGDLCAVSAVPATVAVRWVKKLEQDGWLVRSDADATESTIIELSARGKATMEDYLGSVGRSALQL